MKFLGTLLFNILIIGAAYCTQDTLRVKDVKFVLEDLLALHVENGKFSEEIIKRSISLYMKDFDPNKVYLLQEEVDSLTEIDKDKINKIQSDFQQSKVSQYFAVNKVMEKAAQRSQTIRNQIAKEIKKNGFDDKKIQPVIRYSAFAKTKEELQERLKGHFAFVLSNTRKKELTHEDRIQVFALWDTKKRQFEATYRPVSIDGLAINKQLEIHYTSLHTLKALTKSLDAHSAFYSPEEARSLRASLMKEFEGIGIVLQEEFDGIYIVGVIPGSPAAKSNIIKEDDKIFSVNGKKIKGLTFEEVLSALRGNKKGEVSLVLEREGGKVKAPLKLEKISMDSERVTFEKQQYGNGIIGIINLPGFYENGDFSSESDLKKAIGELRKEDNLLGIVLDIRENGGGFLSQAVKVSGMFIPKSVVVISKYANNEIRYMKDRSFKPYFSGPLILLTSKLSASASEIVAQALQDHGRALIVGDIRSYGKGTMQYQTITNENAKHFYKVTVGKYYTASGRSPQRKGVLSDVVVPSKYSPYEIGEEFLENSLTNDQLDLEIINSLYFSQEENFSLNAVPYMQKRETKWRAMLPNLVTNSETRLTNSRNFKHYLQVIDPSSDTKEHGKKNLGEKDLQLEEAVYIMQDMIAHDRLQKAAS